MSTADTALSISIKMAPGPEHRQEPAAPDKIAESDRAAADVDIESVDATTSGSSSNDVVVAAANTATIAVAAAVVAVSAEQSSNVEVAPANFAADAEPNSGADSKQVSIAGGSRGESRPFPRGNE